MEQGRHIISGAEPSDPEAITVPVAAATLSLPGVVFAVLSADPELLQAIMAAALDKVTLTISSSADRLVEQLAATRVELALIDAASAPPTLGQFLHWLHTSYPRLPLLLVGPGNVQHQLTTQLSDGTIFRFVHKPASAQRLKLFVDAALRELQTTNKAQTPSAAAAAPEKRSPRLKIGAGSPWWSSASQRLKLFVGAALRELQTSNKAQTPSAAAAAPKKRSPRQKIGASSRWWSSASSRWLTPSLAALALIAAAWVVVRHSARPTRSVAPMPATANTITPLAPAAPASVVGAAPTSPRSANAEASAAPTELEQKVGGGAEAVRSESEPPATASQAVQLAVAEQARRTAGEARTRRINQLEQLAQSRIASGALLEPTNDSARAYVSAASGLAPGDPGVRAVSLALGEAMVAEFQKAISAGDASAAEQWLKASDGYPIGEATPGQMSAQLDALRATQQARAAATNAAAHARSEIESASAVVGTRPTAPAERAQEHVAAYDQVIPESQLGRVTFNAPKYPPEALMRGDTGTVDMEFTVTAQGTVTDIRVTESNPRGVFDLAATKALARNRYQPVERDGVPVAQRAHIRMRFAF